MNSSPGHPEPPATPVSAAPPPTEPSLVMPPLRDGETLPAVVIPAPPSFGRQMAQLIIIPAVIVAVAVGVALLFGKIAGGADSLDQQLLKLQQSSGAGKMAMGLQDPRYKDRSLAAYHVAGMIRNLKDPDARLKTSKTLVEILNHNVEGEEDLLQVYLLLAIGQLGQPGGLEAILPRLDHPMAKVREGAVGGVLEWPSVPEARVALPGLTARMADESAMVREKAAVALGKLATREDAGAIAALRGAMGSGGGGEGLREVVWNAAVALARLGDPQGSRFVAEVLLDRKRLAEMSAEETGPQSRDRMSPSVQDRVILSTLAAAERMTDPIVWNRIQSLADNDTNRAVQSAARQLIAARARDAGK